MQQRHRHEPLHITKARQPRNGNLEQHQVRNRTSTTTTTTRATGPPWHNNIWHLSVSLLGLFYVLSANHFCGSTQAHLCRRNKIVLGEVKPPFTRTLDRPHTLAAIVSSAKGIHHQNQQHSVSVQARSCRDRPHSSCNARKLGQERVRHEHIRRLPMWFSDRCVQCALVTFIGNCINN